MIYANFQRNSFTNANCRATGKVDWFLPVSGLTPHPKVIVTDGTRWYVQSCETITGFQLNLNVVAQKDIHSGFGAMIANDQIYLQVGSVMISMDLTLTDKLKRFRYPNDDVNAHIDFLLPLPTGHIVQSFKQGKHEHQSAKRNGYQSALALVDSSATILWRYESKNMHIPAMMTGDMKTLLFPACNGTVRHIDPLNGKEKYTFTLKDRRLLQASMDLQDNIVFLARDPEGTLMLVKTSVEGDPLWEYRLLPYEPRTYLQPPAADAQGRTFFIHAHLLYCISEKGTLQWVRGLPPDDNYEYVSVLNDGSVVATSRNFVRHIAPDGEVLFSVMLNERETISAPPVFDENCGILVATENGVYRIK
jgi:outer membrane protein assembly factor BamB